MLGRSGIKSRVSRRFEAEPHRRQVKAMAAYGIPQEAIAKVIGCDPKTLRKHFRDELDTGAAEANARVAESLYRKALGEGPGAVTAAIFWCKTRLGWREGQVIEARVGQVSPVPLTAEEWVAEFGGDCVDG